MDNKEKIPLKTAFLWISISLFLVIGPAVIGVSLYHQARAQRTKDSKYNINAIVQKTDTAEPLNNLFLAEVLDLSVDRPINLFLLNTKEVRKKLLDTAVIKEAKIRKILPGTLSIEYSIRQPIALLLDYTNTSIDKEGTIFPFSPFFANQNLPEFYLGISSIEKKNEDAGTPIWGKQLSGFKIELALNLFEVLSKYILKPNIILHRIDVSRVDAPSYGDRQIIIMLKEQISTETVIESKNSLFFSTILRLTRDNFQQELANYISLREKLKKLQLEDMKPNLPETSCVTPVVVDLRVPSLAFFHKIQEEKI